jgi:rhodanese-related sulfurtransferase
VTKTFKGNAVKARRFFAGKMAFTTGPVETSHQLGKKADVVIMDLRESRDFKKGHVPGAINLPQEKWGAPAAMQFAAKGYSVMEMDGGFESWKENGLKTAR